MMKSMLSTRSKFCSPLTTETAGVLLADAIHSIVGFPASASDGLYNPKIDIDIAEMKAKYSPATSIFVEEPAQHLSAGGRVSHPPQELCLDTGFQRVIVRSARSMSNESLAGLHRSDMEGERPIDRNCL